ncbi:MAG TPA: hypothetical protein V6C78_01090 [Crinalium sp.]|jgi:hypothetical protein
MKFHKRLSRLEIDDIGGRVRTSEALELEVQAEDEIDIYAALPPAESKGHRYTHRRIKAKAIAEDKLKHLSEQLLELADEIRSLNPAMADALDAAWVSTDEALEVLLNDQMW